MKTNGFVTLMGEEGYDAALYSLSKPYSKSPTFTFQQYMHESALQIKMDRVASRLAWRNNGENKFLRFMTVWIDILAPRHWWAHFDTYKVGVVAQSNSIGNKISSEAVFIERGNCEDGTDPMAIAVYNAMADTYKKKQYSMSLGRVPNKYDLKCNLPEGFLQSRAVATNYATLQTMWYQRHEQEKHPFWKVFFEMYEHLDHADWVRKVEEDDDGELE